MADSLHMKLEVKGDKEIKDMLTGLGLDLRNLRGAMNEVGRDAVKYFSGPVFVSRGSAINQPWQRLSNRYAAQKAKRYAGRPLLVRTGKMQNSFAYNSTGTSVMIFNKDPKFVYHQSSAPRHALPRRAMIGIYNGLQSEVTATIAQVIARKIKERSR